MKVKYAVTFEFQVNAPITVRGEVEAERAPTAARRAIEEAMDQNPNLKWSSISVLLERLDVE
jgi:hypothetical protein